MKFISHRGNLSGIVNKEENDPNKILFCLSKGFDVEIDVWETKEGFYLGHDEPQFSIKKDFLFKQGLWCHAKNVSALASMLLEKKINCFWHQKDDYTITSHGFIWTYPGKFLELNSIAVLPEKENYSKIDLLKCYGVCSDNIFNYVNYF